MLKLGSQVRARKFIQEGDLARDKGRWADAASAYSLAVAENPKLSAIHIQLGHALKESGRLAEAVVAYREAVSHDKDCADAYLHLGHALKMSGDESGAVNAYSMSAHLDPQSRDAKRELRALGAAMPAASGSLSGESLESLDGVASLCFDVSDLLNYFQHSRTPTGIQRVQMNVVESQLKNPDKKHQVSVLAFSGSENYWTEIDAESFLTLCTLARSGKNTDDPVWKIAVSNVHSDVAGGAEFKFIKDATLVNLGTSWWLQNYFLMVRNAKKESGIRYLPFVHDCIPIMTPEHCIKQLTQDFISWLSGVFHHADGFVVNSRATAEDLKFVAGIIGHDIDDPAIVYLDGKFDAPSLSAKSPLSAHGKENEPFILFVSTIESRKNHGFSFDTWLRLIRQRGLENTPNLVCVGKMGWMVDAALARLNSSDLLRQKIVILSGISDGELAKLYQDCLFTIYPSSYEGWGLPVTEALSYGKVPLIASNSSLTEAGGKLAVYFDLQSQNDFVSKLEMLIDDVGKRRALEAKIEKSFRPRDWSSIADEIAGSALKLSSESVKKDAISLAQLGRYESLSRNGETVIWDKMPSGERFRIGTGWNFPDDWGCWMSDAQAELALRIPAGKSARDDLLLIVGFRGLPAGSKDVTFEIEVVGTHAKAQGTLHSGLEMHRSLVIPADAVIDDTIKIRIKSNSKVRLAEITNGIDTRVVTLGVSGFLICEEKDLLSRQRFLEAVQYNGVRSLLEKPRGAGDYAKYRA